MNYHYINKNTANDLGQREYLQCIYVRNDLFTNDLCPNCLKNFLQFNNKEANNELKVVKNFKHSLHKRCKWPTSTRNVLHIICHEKNLN